MAERTRARLRALPAAVLFSVLAVAVVGRLRSKSEPRATASEGAPVAPVELSSGALSPLDQPLRTDPPDAAASPGAPRAIHGGAKHQHRAAGRGPRVAEVRYRVDVGGPIATQAVASPDEGTLYVGTLEGSLVALERASGTRRWAVALGDRVYGTPLVHEDGTIYVGSDAKTFTAVTPAGAVAWKLEVEGEADSGAVFAKDGSIVFAAGKDVFSVRRAGDLAWRFAAKGKVFTAPAVTDDGLVVFGSQDDRVYAIGPGGALKWSVDLGADVDGSPVIGDDGAIYVGTDRGDVVRLDAAGKVVWRTPVGGFVRGVLSIGRGGDVLAGTYGPVPRVVRLSPAGEIRGAFRIAGTGAKEFGIHGAPLEDDEGTLYFGAQDDAAYAIGVDGAVRWRFATKADVDAPLTLLSDGSMVVPSEDGTLTMLLP